MSGLITGGATPINSPPLPHGSAENIEVLKKLATIEQEIQQLPDKIVAKLTGQCRNQFDEQAYQAQVSEAQ